MELQKPNNNGQNPKADPENEKIDQNIEACVAESLFEEVESTCSTPYVSAPSSPGRGSGSVSSGGFYYSAPASPMHFASTTSFPAAKVSSSSSTSSVGIGFEFGSGSSANGSMSSADELFLDGKIRPMKLSTHLEKPQVLAPLLDLDQEAGAEAEEAQVISSRGRDIRVVTRDKSMKRRTRSLSPLRSTFAEDHVTNSASCFDNKGDNNNNNKEMDITTEALSESSSRSSSSAAGRSTSKSWVFFKEFLYRSKSEGRSNNKFWSTISFSPITNKEKKLPTSSSSSSNPSNNTVMKNKPVNGIAGRRRSSPHELHYTANRAQAEEMKKKTYLPYKPGLLGCLGFSSKGYGAMNGFARALNPVSSR